MEAPGVPSLDFATELFETETSVMYFDVNDTYIVRLQSYSPVAYNTYSVRNYDGGDVYKRQRLSSVFFRISLVRLFPPPFGGRKINPKGRKQAEQA